MSEISGDAKLTYTNGPKQSDFISTKDKQSYTWPMIRRTMNSKCIYHKNVINVFIAYGREHMGAIGYLLKHT
jgi:hypothetical protein